MIVLDTHTWVWWVNDPGMLSRRARKAVDAAMGRKELYVSSISAWEVALLAERGRLLLSLDVRDWIARSELDDEKSDERDAQKRRNDL